MVCSSLIKASAIIIITSSFVMLRTKFHVALLLQSQEQVVLHTYMIGMCIHSFPVVSLTRNQARVSQNLQQTEKLFLCNKDYKHILLASSAGSLLWLYRPPSVVIFLQGQLWRHSCTRCVSCVRLFALGLPFWAPPFMVFSGQECQELGVASFFISEGLLTRKEG